MYWFKSKSIAALIVGLTVLIFFPACRPDIKYTGAFDLKGYIIKDAAKLNKLNAAVIKTVRHNGFTETKTVHISDWSRELGFFIESDINKPALKTSYKVIEEDSLLVYKAKDKDMKVQELIIKKGGNRISYILIYNRTQNLLYRTAQKLTYFPDSLYRVETTQSVKLLGANNYMIQGVIKKETGN